MLMMMLMMVTHDDDAVDDEDVDDVDNDVGDDDVDDVDVDESQRAVNRLRRTGRAWCMEVPSALKVSFPEGQRPVV